jgi:glutathione S-transferase
MIIVHHLDNSRSQRILWLLEELGLEYEVRTYKRRPDQLAPPELRAIHPLGKAPVIEDGSMVIAETGAIVDHLIRQYGQGRLIPGLGTPERRAYTYWIYYAEGSAMTPLLLKLVTLAMVTHSPVLIRPLAAAIAAKLNEALVTPQLKSHFKFWEDTLSSQAFFAGSEFSAADIVMSFPLEAAVARAGAGTYPHIKAFVDLIHQRPAYKKALARGGPYIYA